MNYTKQSLVAALLLLAVSINQSIAQTEIRAVEVGASYTVYNRPGLNNYLKVVSDSAQLPNTLRSTPSYGIQLRYLIRKNKIEFEGGLAYSFSYNESKGNSGSIVSNNTHDIGFILGVNYVPVPFIFVGAQFILNSFGGNTKLSGTLPAGITNNMDHPPAAGINIFRGYSFIGRAQLGFNIPFLVEGNRGMRVFGYYDIGSGFDFYNSMDNQLVKYSGNQKTYTTGWGCGLLFYIGKKN